MMEANQDRLETLSEPARGNLLRVAWNSIEQGLRNGTPWPVDANQYEPELCEHRASFVTLERYGQLRGCIGRLEAERPLVEDVAENAFAAAFRDPRFAPLSQAERSGLSLHISVLSLPEPLRFQSEAELIEQLRPGLDGLILEDGLHRGTFLPSVWSSLPEPEEFLRYLKRKAGLPMDHWSDSLRVSRYTTESFP